MSKNNIDFEELDKNLIDIFNSSKRPNKVIEQKLKEIIEFDEN